MNYLKYLSEEIHSTVDEAGQPETCAIDVMDWDESGLYFLTARANSFIPG